jgi:hypothetical protein
MDDMPDMRFITLSLVRRKARSLMRRTLFEQLWFVPLWLLMGIGRLLILTIHFRRLAPHLGRPMGSASWVPLIDAQDEARAHLISRLVLMVARYTPWNSNCFVQAVAARVLLGLYGIPYCLFFGVARDGGGMQAHAWVVAGRIRVCGGESFGEFAVVGCFAAPRLVSSASD